MREGGHDKLALPIPRIARTKGLWSVKPPCRSDKVKAVGPK